MANMIELVAWLQPIANTLTADFRQVESHHPTLVHYFKELWTENVNYRGKIPYSVALFSDTTPKQSLTGIGFLGKAF